MHRSIAVASTSQAGDRGFLALNDLAIAAGDTDYRVVGGHMVQLLAYAFPVAGLVLRATTDADAGIDRLTAAGGELHRSLESHGYQAVSGNQYVRSVDNQELSIDLLVPRSTSSKTVILGDRGFDPIPGLSLALSVGAVQINADVTLRDGSLLDFTVPVPSVEAAVVLKILAWGGRKAQKDLVDIGTLLEIVAAHRDGLEWSLDQPNLRGERLDAARAAQLILIARSQTPARLRALLQTYFSRP